MEKFQSILVEFDANRTLVKSNLIQFFRKDLKLLIRAQIELLSQKYNSWDTLVKKIVAAKAKTSLQLSYYKRNIDDHYSKDNCPNYTVLLKSPANCDNYLEKTQTPPAQKNLTQSPSSGSLRPNNNGSFEKKARKEKKEKYCQEYKKDLNISITDVNINDVTSSRVLKDMSLITCFNYNKTGHYVRSYPKPICNSFKTSKN